MDQCLTLRVGKSVRRTRPLGPDARRAIWLNDQRIALTRSCPLKLCHLDLQLDAALPNRNGLVLEQPERVNLVLLRTAASDFVQRVLQLLPFPWPLYWPPFR